MYGFIYITTNHITGQKYIGQKKYDDTGRWQSYLGSGIHLARAINKYGAKNFSREIIEECETEALLNERECYWIDYYNAVQSNEFYNIAKGGDGGNVISGYTEEERKELSVKLSKLRKGVVNIGKSNGNATRVICLNTMQVFDTIQEASEAYNVNKDAIQQCCSVHNRRRTAGKLNGERLVWEYYDDSKKYLYKPFVREYKSKPVLCITDNTIYHSVNEASDKTGCSVVGIRHCCNGFLKTTKGMQFQYVTV